MNQASQQSLWTVLHFVNRVTYRAGMGAFMAASLVLILGGCGGETTTSSSPSPATTDQKSPDASPAAVNSPEPKKPEGPKSDLTKKLEASASDLVAKEIGTSLTSFSCPNIEKLEAGKTFDCDAEIAAGAFPVAVTLNDDKGSFNVQTKNLLILEKAETLLKSGIKTRNQLDVTADCGKDFHIFKAVGDTYECKLSSTDGRSGKAVLKVTDMEGAVDISYNLR